MRINKHLGIYLAAPIALMTISVTNANADTIDQNQQAAVQTVAEPVSSQNNNTEENGEVTPEINNSSHGVAVSVPVLSDKTSVASSAQEGKSNATSANIKENQVTTDKNALKFAQSAADDSNSKNTQELDTSSYSSPVSYAQLFTSLYTTNYTQQQVNNATYIHDYFINQGWTSNAISGMLGNFVSESGLIPNLHQYGGGPGYGLAQWPASSVQSWCRNNGYDYRSLQGQCAFIQYQMTHGQQFYPSRYSRMTANEYMHSYDSAYNLGMIWLNNFERPSNRNQPARGQQAEYWYQYFQNHGGTTTAPVQQPTQPSITSDGTMQQRGTFRVAYGLNVRQAPSTSAAIVARYSGGQSFTYDSKVQANGYLWVSYMSYSGARRYVAIKNLSTGQTYGTDSNNFTFNNPAPSNPTPVPTKPVTPTDGTRMQQRGTFRVAYGLNIRQAPSTSAAIVARYSGGQSFTYDSKVQANGYLWVSYMSYSGARRYVAIKNLSTGQTYGTDSNNFSFTGMSTGTTLTPSTPSTQASRAEQIISLARQQLGKPYVYGATGPNSFDCSGLVQYVYRQVGVNLPRTAAQQSNCGYSVNMDSLQPGDLLFWRNQRGVYHVGIYTGNGNTLFAPQPGQVVKEQPMRYWMPSFARRVL